MSYWLSSSFETGVKRGISARWMTPLFDAIVKWREMLSVFCSYCFLFGTSIGSILQLFVMMVKSNQAESTKRMSFSWSWMVFTYGKGLVVHQMVMFTILQTELQSGSPLLPNSSRVLSWSSFRSFACLHWFPLSSQDSGWIGDSTGRIFFLHTWVHLHISILRYSKWQNAAIKHKIRRERGSQLYA